MKNLKHLFWFIKKNKKMYILGFIFLFLTNFTAPLPTYFMGLIVDKIKMGAITGSKLQILTGGLLFIVVIEYIFQYLWHFYIFGGSFLAARDFREKIVSKIFKQTPPFFVKNSTGSLMSKATNDVSSIETITGFGVLALLDSTIYPIFIIGIMVLTVSWKMTLLSICVLPLIIFITKILGEKLYLNHKKVQESMEKLNESVLEDVTSIRVIKGFSTQEVTKDRFYEKVEHLNKMTFNQSKLNAIFNPTSIIVPGLSFTIALFLGENLMGLNQLTTGQMISFFFYLKMLEWPMYAFGDMINVVQSASASLERLQEIFDYEEDLVDKENAIEYMGGKDIEFKNFSFKYPQTDVEVLKDINLKIKAGQTLGIVGKIGSGKTTLAKQFLRYYKTEYDTMLFDGKDVSEYRIDSIRDKMGYVSQQHILFSKNVYENISFGKNNATKEDVKKSIDFAAFTKDVDSLPSGLETIIGEKGISISGGQKQRISIARAIIKNPEILILDDSLSAVDAITEKNIIENIKNERVGKSNIIIAHRLSGLKHADNIIVLEDGKIVEQGTHEQLLENRGWYYEQYETQRLGGSDE